MNRRQKREDLSQERLAVMLRQHLAALRESQRGPTLPPLPTADDRAVAARATPAERSRVDALLRKAGFTAEDLARADALRLPTADGGLDELSRTRARALLRRRQ